MAPAYPRFYLCLSLSDTAYGPYTFEQKLDIQITRCLSEAAFREVRSLEEEQALFAEMRGRREALLSSAPGPSRRPPLMVAFLVLYAAAGAVALFYPPLLLGWFLILLPIVATTMIVAPLLERRARRQVTPAAPSTSRTAA